MVELGVLKEAQLVYINKETFVNSAAAIGYKEFFPYFEAQKSLDECVADLKTASRHYAKRQLTWFRRDKEGVWIDLDDASSPQEVSDICFNIIKERNML